MFFLDIGCFYNSSYCIYGLIVPTILLLTLIIARFGRNHFRKQIESECWFCQTISFVPKESENSFTCTVCGQYNGFTEDGDYNKPVPGQWIPEQSFEVYRGNVADAVFTSSSDILCNRCTTNQSAIVQRLSEFEPKREECWDIELKNYKSRLEQLYPLCPTCLTKSKKRIKELDAKLLPNFLNWWNNLRLQKHENISHLSSSTSPIFILSGPLCFIFRVSSLLCVCALLAGPITVSLANRHCKVQTDHNLTLLDRFIIRFEPTALRTQVFPSCTDLLQWTVTLTMPILGQFCFCLLCIVLQSVLICGHWSSQSSARTGVVGLFIFLLDVILLLIVSSKTVSVIPQTIPRSIANQYPFLRFCGHGIVAVLLVPLFFGTCSGLAAWITFCVTDWKAQKKVLVDSWPRGNVYGDFRDESRFANSHYSFSTRSGTSPTRYSHDSDPLEEFGTKLHVSTDKTLFRPSVFSCPPTWSPRSVASFRSTLNPSTKRESFYSAPILSHSPLLRSDDTDVSEITSISRVKKKRASTVCGALRRRKSRRSYRKRSGLLRFFLSLLFGRIETWSDLFAELVCLGNALLVGIVIYGMVRLFVQLIEVL